MGAKTIPEKKRRFIRFPPDPGTLAVLQFQSLAKDPVELYGLVLNESQGGCAVVVAFNKEIPVGTDCVSQVGKLGEVPALIRWVKQLEKGLYKIGVEYLI